LYVIDDRLAAEIERVIGPRALSLVVGGEVVSGFVPPEVVPSELPRSRGRGGALRFDRRDGRLEVICGRCGTRQRVPSSVVESLGIELPEAVRV
jgi:hypothetical protein